MKEIANLLVRLEECEHKFFGAVRRGLEATCVMSRALRQIREQELWKARQEYKSYRQYLMGFLQFEEQTANRIESIGPVVDRLHEAGLQLPANETQVAELARLEPEEQAQVWKQVLIGSEKTEMPITAKIVRKAVEVHERHRPEPETKEQKHEPSMRPGVKTALDLDDNKEAEDDGKKAPKVPERVTFSEKGEMALERIGRLCGKATSEAIEKGNVAISERDLIKWAEEEDWMVKSLRYYVIDQRWRVDKAIAFENRTINGETTLNDLVTMVAAHGGRFSFEFESIKFSAIGAAAA